MKRHDMAAKPPLGEEAARAVPLPLFIAKGMDTVFPPEAQRKVGKGYTLSLLSIAVSLFDLANEA